MSNIGAYVKGKDKTDMSTKFGGFATGTISTHILIQFVSTVKLKCYVITYIKHLSTQSCLVALYVYTF